MPRLNLYAAGSNSHGQLGIGSEDDAHRFTKCDIDIQIEDVHEDTDNFKIKLCAGANHTLLLVSYGDSTRELFVAGSSRRGQLGQLREGNKLSFERIILKALLEFARKDIESVKRTPTLLHQDWSLKDIATAWETSFFLLESIVNPQERILLACGSDDFGLLGSQNVNKRIWSMITLLSEKNKVSQILSGPRHTIAVTEQGQLYGWGASRHGQLGIAITDAITYTPTALDLESQHGLTQDNIALGNQHTCIVTASTATSGGNVVLLGNNRKGQLGTSDGKARQNKVRPPGSEEVSQNDERRNLAVFANWNSTLILDNSQNKLYSFGNNASGQLGRINDASALGEIGQVEFGHEGAGECNNRPKIIQVAAGSEHTLALLEGEGGERQVWGWGWNEHGNLGGGSLEDVRKPVRIELPDEGRIHSVHAGNGTSWIVTFTVE